MVDEIDENANFKEPYKRKADNTTWINVVPKKKIKYLQRYNDWYHTT